MKQIKVLVSFEDNEMIFPNIELVENDYNHVEFIFDFDEDDGKKVFELKKPNGKVFIKEIIDNKVVLSNLDEKGNIIPVINQSGKYEFEITKYKSDSKFTINKTCHFVARDEVVNVDDDIVDKDASLPILNDLITTTIALKENTEKVGQLTKEKGDYAEEQGNYAKKAASNVINANNQAAEIIKNFEFNVNEYTASFNKNATTKQDEFDSNSATEINEYNDNATLKLKSYNDNHEVKMKDYNDNAIEKTKAFNSNAEVKTTAYDKNADDKLSAYNTNDATKLDEYNDNATLKTEEYNTNASSKIEEYNSNATQKLEEYDEHSEELNNKINSTNSELEKLKNEIFEIGEVSDSFIHVEDSKKNELLKLEVDGVCEQEITSGYNLFDKDSIVFSKNFDKNGNIVNNTSTNFYSPIYIKVKPNTNYIFTTVKDGNAIAGWSRFMQYDENKNFIIGTVQATKKMKTLTNAEYVRLGGAYNSHLYMQLIEGDIEKPYEPYSGGRPSPNPDYPQEIKTIENSFKITSCNKNLFDKSKYSNIDITMRVTSIKETNNGIKIDFTSNADSYIGTILDKNLILDNKFDNLLISVKDNTRYTLYCKTGFPKCFVCYLDKNKISLGYYQFSSSYTMGSKTFTTPKYCKYVIIRLGIQNSEYSSYTFEEIHLEQDTTSPTFEQHLETQITANLPEGEFIGKINDTYKDNLKVEYNEEDGQYHLKLYKHIGKYLITGNETISMYDSYDKKMFGIQTDFNYEISLSNYYSFIPESKKADYSISKSYKNKIQIRNKDYDNADDFKMHLKQLYDSGKAVEIYCNIWPYVLDLGVIDMPITYNEITNLFTDSDLLPKINAKYYRNFVTTIQNLQVNEKSLKQELADINKRLTALETAQANVVESEVVNNE